MDEVGPAAFSSLATFQLYIALPLDCDSFGELQLTANCSLNSVILYILHSQKYNYIFYLNKTHGRHYQISESNRSKILLASSTSFWAFFLI
jgi:hypothetical protein